MPSPRVATLCVGISNYDPDVLKAGELPLHFAASSATELHALLQQLWPGDDSSHILRCDHEATFEVLQRDVDAMQGIAFDLLFVYVAGHGRVSSGGFSFVLSGAGTPNRVTWEQLDAWFSRVGARQRVVVVDACNAGRFLDDTALVRATGTTRAAFVLAAATREQRAWEDPFLSRTLLADALHHGLTGDISKHGPVDVPAQLFPFVSAYVTRHAYGLKDGGKQEPVWGGMAAELIAFPVGRAPAGPTLTTRQVLIRRTRQILFAMMAVAVVFLLALLASTWRPALNESGALELRAGPKWLYFLNVGPLARRVETDIRSSDLITPDTDATVLDRLRNEEGLHTWSGENTAGLRRWIDVVLPWMTDEARTRWQVRLDVPGTGDRLLATGKFGVKTVTTPRATRFAAEQALLQNAPLREEAWQRQWREWMFGVPCGATAIPSELVDRTELFANTTTPEESVAWLEDLALTARVSDAVTFEHVRTLVELFHAVYLDNDWRFDAKTMAERHLTPEVVAENRVTRLIRPDWQEIMALGDLAEAVAVRRRERGAAAAPPADVRALIRAAVGPCSDWIAPALASLGPDGAPAEVTAWLRTRQSEEGYDTVLRLAQFHALPAHDIEWVLGTFGFGRDDAGTKNAIAGTRKWLVSVAAHEPLPASVITELLQFARRAIARGDTATAMDALRPVAWNADVLEPGNWVALRTSLRALRAGQPLALMSAGEVELWGIATAHGVIDPEVTDAVFHSMLEGQSPPSVVFPPPSEDGTTVQLAAGWSIDHLIAFARIAGRLPATSPYRGSRAIAFLEQACRDAFRAGVAPEPLRDVYRSLATLQLAAHPRFFASDEVRRRLGQAQDDAGRRSVVVNTLFAYLDGLPPNVAHQRINMLRGLWKSEREPDIKYALATLIVDAERDIRLPRFR